MKDDILDLVISIIILIFFFVMILSFFAVIIGIPTYAIIQIINSIKQ